MIIGILLLNRSLIISPVCLHEERGLVTIKLILILNFFIESAVLFISAVPVYVRGLSDPPDLDSLFDVSP